MSAMFGFAEIEEQEPSTRTVKVDPEPFPSDCGATREAFHIGLRKAYAALETSPESEHKNDRSRAEGLSGDTVGPAMVGEGSY